MAKPAIVVDEVSKRYRLYLERNQGLKASIMRGRRAVFEELWALRDVSFDVAQGSTFGIIGENGSGKSTLLKCMARILRPDHGRITVTGKVSALLELGAGFHQELTGRENVYLNGSILGLSKREIDARFDDIVEFAGLERFIDSPVKNYSSGMYIRLGFSVAINVDPDVLLIDEILAVGDEQFQRQCSERFADLKASGKTLVIVSHALGSLRTLCDELVWLEHGLVKDIGPSGQVIDEYVDLVRTDGPQPSVEQESRAGSGEARVTAVELLDATGTQTTRVRTGDRVVLRLHYSCTEPVPRPVFGITVQTIEGVRITGPGTRDAECIPDKIHGEGHVDLCIERLMLLPGTYEIGTTITDYAILHEYESWAHAFRFDVEPGEPREYGGGIISLGGTWDVGTGEEPG